VCKLGDLPHKKAHVNGEREKARESNYMTLERGININMHRI
jgi:hypothetical protein